MNINLAVKKIEPLLIAKDEIPVLKPGGEDLSRMGSVLGKGPAPLPAGTAPWMGRAGRSVSHMRCLTLNYFARCLIALFERILTALLGVNYCAVCLGAPLPGCGNGKLQLTRPRLRVNCGEREDRSPINIETLFFRQDIAGECDKGRKGSPVLCERARIPVPLVLQMVHLCMA